MAEFASNGKGNLGVTLGAIGTGLGVIGPHIGNAFAGFGCGNNGGYVSHEAFELQQKISTLESEKSLLASEQNTEVKVADVYERLASRIRSLEDKESDKWASQGVINAQLISGQSVLQSQVSELIGMSKRVIPNTSVCPGWGNVTITPATT